MAMVRFVHGAIAVIRVLCRTFTGMSYSQQDLRRAVDLEVIRASTDDVPASTESSSTHESFRDQLLSRDGRCVWTGIKQGVGLHIIPYSRGDTVRFTISTLWKDVSDRLPSATYFSGFS